MIDYNKIELSILNQKIENIEKILSEKQIKNIHIDIMDGYFVDNLSSISPFLLKNIKTLENYNLHLHFMVQDVYKFFSYYDFLKNIKKVSFHIESKFIQNGNIKNFFKKLKQKNIKIGLAINPDTKLKEIYKYLDKIDFVLIMTVIPGKGGQKFIETILEKIDNLRKIFKKEIIIDGGVNDKIFEKLKQKVDNFVIGSFLFKDF